MMVKKAILFFWDGNFSEAIYVKLPGGTNINSRKKRKKLQAGAPLISGPAYRQHRQVNTEIPSLPARVAA